MLMLFFRAVKKRMQSDAKFITLPPTAIFVDVYVFFRGSGWISFGLQKVGTLALDTTLTFAFDAILCANTFILRQPE